MPYKDAALRKANDALAAAGGSPSEELTEVLRGGTLDEIVAGLDLAADLAGTNDRLLVEWLRDVPPAIDASVRAALSSATERGLHSQVVWKPGAAWTVEVWEVSDVDPASGAPVGTVTVLLTSVPPVEDRGGKGGKQ